MSELPKGFEHKDVDPKWYGFWEEIGAFRADARSNRPRFSMALPPPNVTGSLHIGHALNQTLPDIVARWKRMHGYDVLWLPGTDHAGIATQNVVEKQLAAEKKTRYDLGREAFEARVWDWVEQSRGTITGQMRKLGSSVDWSRERFTLDENLSRAVRRVFVSLYRDGLIYRGAYIVNWCPRCRTALSDLEVIHQETGGRLYHVDYPLADGSGVVTVATTRPETMLGDTGLAVHPGDERFSGLVGRRARLPVIGRELPIVADDFVNPEFGTGVVKVTPAHDPNDFALGQRHGLPQVSVIDEDGRMTAQAGPYAGLDRFKARALLVEELQKEGLLRRIDEHRHAVGHCERCNTVVEPLVSTQWFVRIEPLAAPAREAVDAGRIRFVPANWKKTYDEWMLNIRDWCISRQLWWGHRIPAWYCDACSRMIVAEETPERCDCGGSLRQETDVLDTWFSSGLWPFTTLGWPDRTEDLDRYYPTDLMITGFDIIFFWVARMIMLGLAFADDVPFREVYITSLVRDAHGQKMSKSKGNVVDPLQVMDDIGADAFRFTLAALASPGMDISLSEGRLRGYRQFINKVWNASRFLLMNVPEGTARPPMPRKPVLVINRWILYAVSRLADDVDHALTEYRFDVAADRLYQFFWHEYADWYIEMVKPHLAPDAAGRAETVEVMLEAHDQLLRLFHPFIPFVTEEIWQQLPRKIEEGESGRKVALTLASFPRPRPEWEDPAAAAEVELVKEVVTTIRTARSERGVPPSRKLGAFIEGAIGPDRQLLERNLDYVIRLAGLDRLDFSERVERHPDTVRRLVRGMQVHVPLAGIVDREAERERNRRELDKIRKQHEGVMAKLSNAAFREKADADVVREAELQAAHLDRDRDRLERILEELGG
jgi:valyl-tRNA synthetase